MSGDCKIEDNPAGGMLCQRYHRKSLYLEYSGYHRITKEHARKTIKNKYNDEKYSKKNSGKKQINKFQGKRGGSKIRTVRRWEK